MTTSATATPPASAEAGIDRHSEFNKGRLFVISVLALVTAGVAFSLRNSIAGDLKTEFLDPIDAVKSAGMLGGAMGVAFLGFAFSIALGSPLLDLLGMRTVLLIASASFIAGTALIEFTPHTPAAYSWLYFGCLLSGVAWGSVETVINPLTATLYPKDKTTKLNVLHAWWPGGIIMGGLIGLAIGKINMGWQAKYAVVFIPALVFGFMVLTTKFPKTERAAAGVSNGVMFKQLGRPLFIIFFLSMFLTAASELAPGSWVDFSLSKVVGFPGILLLVYISGLMFVMRNFSGALAHRLSPVGVLWVSCLLAAIGLFLLSQANNAVTALVAATVWGTGVCFMWPTMLAASSERFPKGGALLMGLMGTAGTMSIWFFLPQMGNIYDSVKVSLANKEEPKAAPALMFEAIGNGVGGIVHSVIGGGDAGAKTPEQTAREAKYTDLEAAVAAAKKKAETATPDTKAAADAELATANRNLDGVLMQAGSTSFRAVAILPALLLLVFGAIWLYDRSRGGYKPEELKH